MRTTSPPVMRVSVPKQKVIPENPVPKKPVPRKTNAAIKKVTRAKKPVATVTRTTALSNVNKDMAGSDDWKAYSRQFERCMFLLAHMFHIDYWTACNKKRKDTTAPGTSINGTGAQELKQLTDNDSIDWKDEKFVGLISDTYAKIQKAKSPSDSQTPTPSGLVSTNTKQNTAKLSAAPLSENTKVNIAALVKTLVDENYAIKTIQKHIEGKIETSKIEELRKTNDLTELTNFKNSQKEEVRKINNNVEELKRNMEKLLPTDTPDHTAQSQNMALTAPWPIGYDPKIIKLITKTGKLDYEDIDMIRNCITNYAGPATVRYLHEHETFFTGFDNDKMNDWGKWLLQPYIEGDISARVEREANCQRINAALDDIIRVAVVPGILSLEYLVPRIQTAILAIMDVFGKHNDTRDKLIDLLKTCRNKDSYNGDILVKIQKLIPSHLIKKGKVSYTQHHDADHEDGIKVSEWKNTRVNTINRKFIDLSPQDSSTYLIKISNIFPPFHAGNKTVNRESSDGTRKRLTSEDSDKSTYRPAYQQDNKRRKY